jgi:arsenite methyltransferase
VDRCRFVRASGDDLSGLEDASVDVVTTRSVLIYIDRKTAAFTEFFRVLRAGGRLSIFEPINSFAALHGSFDLFERHLLLCVRAAGFTAIELDYHVEWDVPQPPPQDWEALLHTAPNPLAPTYAEAMAATLTGAESDTLREHLHRLVEAQTPARRTMATAYLSARRP